MSILITLLLNFLVSFIVMLIKQWLFPSAPSMEYLQANKELFLKKVGKRFWLGSKRLERASKAYDLAISNYLNLKLGSKPSNGSEELVAKSLIQGIAEQL